MFAAEMPLGFDYLAAFEEAYTNIKHFIELVYNEKRLHSSIGYLPPAEFETEVLNKKSLNLL